MLQSWIGLIGCTLLVATAALSAMRGRFRPVWLRCLVLAVVVIGMWVPIDDGVNGAEYLRALSGDLSITSLFLLGIAFFTQLSNRTTFRPSAATLVFALGLAGGLILYPLELGLSRSTPYEVGYGSNLFFAALLLVALSAWYVGELLTVYCILIACAGYLLGVLESRNLWDYLFDTVLVFFAPIWLTVRAIQYRLSRARKTESVPVEALPQASI